MAYENNIIAEQHWFIGEDKLLEFEILGDDGKLVTDPTKAVEDAATWSMVYSLRKKDDSGDPALVEKRTSTGGIAVIGIYNVSRAVNTQRVRVTIIDTDTDVLKAATLRHSLKRLTDGSETILTFGSVALLKATAPAS